ncbi:MULTISPECIES: type II secretion system protein GspL [unclassified Sphingomonas]|uniref:type II secretion system protein GspL n=1 Tax=unclassified Sphingomonas TaxID=196159 RepID=UPI0006FAE80C|nr:MULTISPECIES: type II secretion system protein GspL [unclassified Sphingomonas]KQX21658.1 hypothetical protein ASD17_06835 [Sphingomonas sp. Root1294]KQY72974.1 hypothetical protein ASD39_00820 [Sphingomonas sp. Root50]KRB88231.1 hypothetical protein ASE22_22615 [Sphingomonas sp. Root720]
MLGPRAEAGVWRLDRTGVRAVAGSAARAVLLVPAEHVLTMSVALPLPSHARRLAALPFAIEERIADRADAVHLALGTQVDGGPYLVGVVDRALVAAWVAAAAEAGIADAAIMPDALALPMPQSGRWNVRRESDGRILVRAPEGTGFAATEPLFVALWTAAGKPDCDEVADSGETVPVALDLRQGDFARPRQGLSRIGRRVAIVAAAGLIAHGAIAAADMVALRSVAAKRGAELTALLNTAAPGRYGGNDPREAALVAAELLPVGGNAPPGQLLPLLGRTSAALAPFGGTLAIRSMRFDEARRSLRLDVELADPGARANIVSALRSAGLTGRFDGDDLVVGGGAA